MADPKIKLRYPEMHTLPPLVGLFPSTFHSHSADLCGNYRLSLGLGLGGEEELVMTFCSDQVFACFPVHCPVFITFVCMETLVAK